MRESQMKKIIAAAVATAFVAPAFAADVTISGDVEYVLTSQGSVTSGTTGDADFKIAATEDLGNGMSVMAYIDFDSDYNASTAASPQNRPSKMEISGSFGTIEIGNDTGEAIGEFDEVADVAEQGAGTTLSDGHSNDFGIGFKPNLGIEGLSLAVSFAAGSASEDTTATSIAVQYEVSGVKVAYGTIDKEVSSGTVENPTVLSVSTSMGPVYVGYENISNQGGIDGDDVMALGITYDYGNGKLFFESNEYKDKDATTLDNETTAYGVSYKLGAVNTYVSVIDSKTNLVEADSATKVGVEYAF
jgi:hypothetical protein